MTITEFQNLVWHYGRTHGRHGLPWRDDPSPYKVVVSELMLQQTQVERVIPKFHEFIKQFPTFSALARASLSDVLRAWQGLGYNRRAKYLHGLAKVVARQGALPRTPEELVKLPGIGKNTAGAILAYAFNQPVVYIETNIRTAYLHHFFADQFEVDDKQLLPFIEQTLDQTHPRQWYSALMDYGTFLKKQGLGRLTASKHYKKQTAFEGSTRQLRGAVLRVLSREPLVLRQLQQKVGADERFELILTQLKKEQLIVFHDEKVWLAQ